MSQAVLSGDLVPRLSHYVHQPVANNDGYNADNEPFDEEDAYIASVVDPVAQQELRWQKYLRRLSEGAWGDTIPLMGINRHLIPI